MKTILFFVIIVLLNSNLLWSQVGINTNNNSPDPSAMLDVQSATKGMLIPRMTFAERTAITSPANGLMVYQTDGVTGFYYYNNTVWQRIGETDGSETKVTAGVNVTVTGTGTIANPYVINANGGGSSDHWVGELYGGGIVFWVDNTGQHGLIASLIDVSQDAQWSNITDVLIGPTAESTWNGQGNSTAIMGQSGHTNSAAKLCNDYVNANYGTGIYSDWYLPAIDQLSLMYHARYILNKNIESALISLNILNPYQSYWSSTESWDGDAWYIGFDSGAQTSEFKMTYFWVRAIRAF